MLSNSDGKWALREVGYDMSMQVLKVTWA